MKTFETERLHLRPLQVSDAEFILELLNEPAFIQNIGDRGVRTLEDARKYIENGPLASYESLGFGLYLVALRETGVPIGMCGLLKRDHLEHVDLGYAFFERCWGKGYALESARAVRDFAREGLGLTHLAAVVNPDNYKSIHVLEKLGMKFVRMVQLSVTAPEIKLYLMNL